MKGIIELKKLTLLLAFLTFPATNFAYEQDFLCPSVAAIRSQGLDYVEKSNFGDSWMAVKQQQTYDTDDNWNFMIWPVNAKSDAKAMSKSLKLLNNLSFASARYSADGFKVCDYTSDSEMVYIWATTERVIADLGVLRW